MALKKEFRIGILAVCVLLASIFVINYLRGADILGREITLKAYFDDVETLVASAPVRIRGYNAGRVSEVSYVPATDNFLVECAVSREFRIPADSRIVIYSTSIMGGKGVRIEMGESSSLVSDGSVLQGGSEEDLLSSLGGGIGPLVASLQSVIDSLNVTVGSVNAVLGDENRSRISSSLEHLRATLSSARSLAAGLDGKSSELESLIDNLQQLSGRLAPIADQTSGVIVRLDSVAAQLQGADLGRTVEEIGSAVRTIDSTVEKISVPLDSVLRDADDFIKKVKDNPKKYIKISVF